MVTVESESQRRHRMPRTKRSLLNLNPGKTKRSLSNLNLGETKQLLLNLNLKEGIGCLRLNDYCQI